MTRRLPLLLAAEALALTLLRVAADLRLDWFGAFDGGGELSIQAMRARGLRPTVDFAYIYGLLPLAAGEMWYCVWGLRPEAFAAACAIGNVVSAWAIGRALVEIRAGRAGAAWVALMMPVGMVSAAWPSMTHAMEPALLMLALADLAEGRPRRAVAILAACAFVKPSMAFLAAVAVTGCWRVAEGPKTWADLARFAAPAVATAIGLGVVLGAWFGWDTLGASIVPRAGLAVYRANHFGFVFGIGREFWLPKRPTVAYYLGTEAGIWIVAVGLLTVAAIAQGRRARREAARAEGRPTSGLQVLICCAALHAAFLGLFFGNPWSWFYYFPILTLGVAAVASRSRAGAAAVAVACVLAVPTTYRALRGPVEAWQGRSATPEIYRLWASPVVRQEWATILAKTEGTRPALLATSDGIAVLDPRFGPPEVAFLVRGQYLTAEMARKVARIEAATFVVVANPTPKQPWHDEWPEFVKALSGHRIAWECPRWKIYARRGAGASASSSKNAR